MEPPKSYSKLESKLALVRSMRGDSRISEKESEDNVLDNLVLISRHYLNGAYSNMGNGLMVTTDGFIITAAHLSAEICFNSEIYYIAINRRGERYLLDATSRVSDVDYDISLIKAYSSAKPEPIPFRINHRINVGNEVKLNVLLGPTFFPFLYDNDVDGKIINLNFDAEMHDSARDIALFIRDSFCYSITAQVGCSGGVVTNSRGEIVGIHSYGAGYIPYSGGVAIKRAVDLVQTFYDS